MTIEKLQIIQMTFDSFVAEVFTVERDLQFWESFLNISIKDYQNQDNLHGNIYSAVFTTYDIDINTDKALLKSYQDITFIKKLDLEEHKTQFIKWILNLCLIKSYNALEILLLQSIWLEYFPNLKNPSNSKKNITRLLKAIKDELVSLNIEYDKTNNRYLIEFLKVKSPNFAKFSQKAIRIDLSTTWLDYFELISILRHVVAHQSSTLNIDTQNEIKSRSKDIFERHFTLRNTLNGDKQFQVNENIFRDFLNYTSEFAANSLKFIFNENDLNFIKLTIP